MKTKQNYIKALLFLLLLGTFCKQGEAQDIRLSNLSNNISNSGPTGYSYDFGIGWAFEKGWYETFYIYNDDPLDTLIVNPSLNNYYLSGDSAFMMEINNFQSIIPPGQSTSIDVHFFSIGSPGQSFNPPINYSGSLQLSSNDPQDSIIIVSLSASAQCWFTKPYASPSGSGGSSVYFDFTATFNNETCPGASDGSIFISFYNTAGYYEPDLYLNNNNNRVSIDYFSAGGQNVGYTTIDSLPAGSYVVGLSDNYCHDIIGVTIGTNSNLTISTTSTSLTCNGISDGSATAIASGGSAPYTYNWSNGATTSTINNLSAGSYSVTVSDAGGCIVTDKISIVDLITVQLYTTNESSAGNDGAISATVFGGVTPYSFQWSNGSSTANISGLTAGVYTVTITDANGCTGTASSTIIQYPTNTGQSWDEVIKAVASDRGSDDYFGFSVAISGDYAIVGARNHDVIGAGGFTFDKAGSAYLFKNIAGTWTEVQKIMASDKSSGDYFGSSVAISGDYAIVGAPSANSAYLFKNDLGSWSEVQKLQASDLETYDGFGSSVAISGDYALVGSPYDTTGGNFLAFAGSASLFKNNSGSWSEVQKLVASDREANDGFGSSVAISGDYALVGSPNEDHDTTGGNFLDFAGSAYLFKNNSGSWSEVQKLVAADRGYDDRFGYSVAISGNNAIIGAYHEQHDKTGGNSLFRAGSAYIFKNYLGSWSEVQKLVASDREANDGFGSSVAISGDYALVGSPSEGHDTTGGSFLNFAGSAYLFKNDMGSWSEFQKLVAADREAGDRFGVSVAISGGLAISGALFEDHDTTGGNALSEAGSAYIFSATTSPCSLSVQLTSINDSCYNNGGSATASASGGSAPYTYNWSNGATTSTINNLSAGSYSVTVSDVNGCTTAESSNVIQDPNCIAPPQNLISRYIQDTSVRLNWDTVQGATLYKILWRKASESNWNRHVRNIPIGRLDLDSLQPNTKYFWAVRAYKPSAGWSDFSSLENFTTLSGPCEIPDGLTSNAITDNRARLMWNVQANALKYRIRYRPLGGNWDKKLVLGSRDRKFLKFLTPSTTYEWQIKSICTYGPSFGTTWSSMQQFTTDPSPSSQARMKSENEEVLNEVLSVFPNPNNGEFTIRFDREVESTQIRITDISGRTVYEGAFSKKQQIDLDPQISESGVYLLFIQEGERQTVKRLVIQK